MKHGEREWIVRCVLCLGLLAATVGTVPGQNVRIVGSFGPTTEWLEDVFEKDHTVYAAAGGDGLLIFDVVDPTSPALIGAYRPPFGNEIFVSGTVAYLADGTGNLVILDVSIPNDPGRLFSYGLQVASAEGVFVSGGLAYVACGNDGLKIVDVSDPTSPTLRGSVDTPDRAVRVHVVNRFAYVADSNSGLQIIDARNPDAPQIRGFHNPSGTVSDVRVSGTVAYVADTNLLVLDVSDPSAPTPITALPTAGSASSLDLSGNLLYVGNGSNGLEVVDVSDPAAPVARGKLDLVGFGHDVAFSHGLIFMPGFQNGLMILQFTGDAPRIEAVIASDLNRNGSLDGGDQLVLTMTRSVFLRPGFLMPEHFFLPVAGDSLGTEGFAVDVNPVNSRQVVLRLGLDAAFTGAGDFDIANRAAGSPSGVDFASTFPFNVIVSRDFISVIDGGAPLADDAAVDVQFALIEQTTDLGPSGGWATVMSSPDAAYQRHGFNIPAGVLATTATIRMRQPAVNLGVTNAVRVDVVSGPTSFPAAQPASVRVQYLEHDVDREGGLLESEMRVHQLVENPMGTFQYVVVPGDHRLSRTAARPEGTESQKLDATARDVSVDITTLNPAGSLGETGVFAGIPVDTVDERSITIKPGSAPAPIVRGQTGASLVPGPGGAYTLHRIEFPDYQAAAETDADRLVVTMRTATLAERVSLTGGQSFPPFSGAVFVVTVEDALGQPAEFTSPVAVTVQFKSRLDPVQSDLVRFSGWPALIHGMRVACDTLTGDAVSFAFVSTSPDILDTSQETVTVENFVGLTGPDGKGTFGAVASGFFTRTGHWSLYR